MTLFRSWAEIASGQEKNLGINIFTYGLLDLFIYLCTWPSHRTFLLSCAGSGTQGFTNAQQMLLEGEQHVLISPDLK